MKFIPLTVTTPLIPRLLDDSKTETRRIAKLPPLCEQDLTHILTFGYKLQSIPCPYAVGDILWVREEHYAFGWWNWVEGEFTKTGKQKEKFIPTDDPNMNAIYFSDNRPETLRMVYCRSQMPYWHKRLARFMPARYARIFLEITGVKLQRLQDINHWDAQHEGIIVNPLSPAMRHAGTTIQAYLDGFKTIWEKLHGPDSWAANPIVWVITFKRISKPSNFPHQ